MNAIQQAAATRARSLRVGCLIFCLGLAAADAEPGAAELQKTTTKTETFDRDPGWEGFNNRIVPKKIPTITQDFGYSPTNFAGKHKGEMGGRITRAMKPAFYAVKIRKTLNDKLTASGTFAITGSTPGSGIFFGWFNAAQPGGGGRPVNSLGLDFDGEGSGGRLAVRLINSTNKSCGTFITPFIPGKFRPTPIKNDGTRYTWTLTYDPQANEGNGRFHFMIKSNSARPEEFEGKVFTVDLPPGFKLEGAVFDHFGIMNMMKPGGFLVVYFDDLTYDGTSQDFSSDPAWVGSGNRTKYEERDQVGAHDFGYSKTSFAGGAAGEIGGKFWRSGTYAYYADRVGLLTLNDRLQASGRVILLVGAPDSDMYLGWFSSMSKDKAPAETADFLGVHVGGPTRIGHYFQPAFATSNGTRGRAEKAPIIVPGKVYEWSLLYDPAAENGQGAIRVALGKDVVVLPLKKGQKSQGARFDRFGLLTSTAGGQLVRLFVDDLKYTVRSQ